MTEVRRLETIAAVDTPHGAWCVQVDGQWLPSADLGRAGGVSAGPHSVDGFTLKGRPLQIQTDGGVVLLEGAAGGRWVVLEHGRISNPGGGA